MRALLMFLLAMAPLTRAAAQDLGAEREGFWFGFTAGIGRQYVLRPVSCDPAFGGCFERNGVTAGARVGGAVARDLLWGFEFVKWCWLGNGGCPTGTSETLTTGLTWYPMPLSGFRIRAGAGYGVAVSQELTDHADFAMTFALGYDFALRGGVGLGPELFLQCYGTRCSPDYLMLTVALTRY
jgi:hypothetical protein